MKKTIDTILEKKMDRILGKVTKMAVKPKLTIVTVGKDNASQIYVRNKKNKLTEVGIEFSHINLPTSTQSELDQIAVEHDNPILFQLPLPDGLQAPDLPAYKDVDAFGTEALGKIALGNSTILPCTVQAVIDILDAELEGSTYAGLNVGILGRSNIVGKPLALELINRQCTVTSMNSKSLIDAQTLAPFDVLVVATGCHGVVKASMFKSGTLVIDVGINRVNGKVAGDVEHDCNRTQAKITPVPHGVGRLTVVNVLANVVSLQEKNC